MGERAVRCDLMTGNEEELDRFLTPEMKKAWASGAKSGRLYLCGDKLLVLAGEAAGAAPALRVHGGAPVDSRRDWLHEVMEPGAGYGEPLTVHVDEAQPQGPASRLRMAGEVAVLAGGSAVLAGLGLMVTFLLALPGAFLAMAGLVVFLAGLFLSKASGRRTANSGRGRRANSGQGKARLGG